MNSKKIYRGFVFVYICFWIYGMVHNIQIQDWEGIGMEVVAIFTPIIIPVLFKIFHFKPVYEIYSLNILFVFFASLLGSCFAGYKVPYFDKIVHFFSGLFMTLIAALLFSAIKHTKKPIDKEDYKIYLLFVNALNLAVALLWEFFEFLMLVFFNNDCIRNKATGVYDSMTDMMCAFVGGIIMTVFLVRYIKNNKQNFFIRIYEKFYLLNIETENKSLDIHQSSQNYKE
ncbi:DUF2238 domain-containing protein [Floccifex sp.]|uniref:DUF2238 domain-containing protein n=1 Tax=Floccifex sp. TaxID=2815810 RepID=UPI002A752F24|nr:DUF2238 domain-containing protein [Floccifex sp.]MDD7281855.1 DUF2238 domain-containing protein [Erysipelotrichaceae bacterium]MDY2958709.1 DUF2238 domain-containing protein [Floccifex sp.]